MEAALDAQIDASDCQFMNEPDDEPLDLLGDRPDGVVDIRERTRPTERVSVVFVEQSRWGGNDG